MNLKQRLIAAQGTIDSVPSGTVVIISIYKNGVEYKRGRVVEGSATNSAGGVSASVVLDMNGTDYLEFYIYHEAAGSLNLRGTTTETYATGVRVTL